MIHEFSTPQDIRPTISLSKVQHDDGSFGVELIVSGLTSEAQANAAMDHLERTLCGPEFSLN